ncbi:MAG: arginase family protein, partial [Candidatus Thorarchaeota archaeon]
VYPQNEDLHRISIEKSIKFLLESSNALIICVGGDHSITFPEINAYSKFGLVGVIWIDAHRDVLDELNNSKYSHGSSLRRAIENKSVLPDNVLLIGTRYMEASETEFIQKYGISELSMVEIEESHRKRILIKDKILKLANSVDLIFLSIDIDVVDPAYAPGTGTPVAGGMTSNLLLNIIHDFPSPIRGLDIVEVSPPLDPSGITTKLQMAMITELCAKVI